MSTNNPILDAGLTFLRDVLSRAVSPAPAPAASPVPTPTGAQKPGLEDIKLDELTREKVRLVQEQRKKLEDARTLELDKNRLFEEGKRNSSEREQIVLAYRIKELDEQIKNTDLNLKTISKQMRILNGLIQIKENVRLNKESAVGTFVSNIDLEELTSYVESASVDGEFQMGKFDKILGDIEKSKALTPQESEDEDVLKIVKQMQMAHEAEDDSTTMNQQNAEFNKKTVAKSKEAGEEAL